ncbi:MAG: MotA/TolQ/ExbB proton channel family protein [Puniceicoccales bacterium]|nr:MotA/TolQ/ExbB proton channel family protein [Puniceicoccales bacterium]
MGHWSEIFLHLSIRLTAFMLLALSATGATLILERGLLFHRARLRSDALIAGLKNLLSDGRTGEAAMLCAQTPGPLPRVLRRILSFNGENWRCAEGEYVRQAELEQRTLERHMGAIALAAKLLPLIGCLGTLLSILSCLAPSIQLDSYPSMGEFAPSLLSAFWMACFGTGDAIAMNLGYHLLHGKLRNCLREIYAGAEELYASWILAKNGKAPCETQNMLH